MAHRYAIPGGLMSIYSKLNKYNDDDDYDDDDDDDNYDDKIKWCDISMSRRCQAISVF